MGYLFAILGSITGLFSVAATVSALGGGTEIQLILGGVYWIATAVFWIGAGIVFRMDENHSKKDAPK